MANRFWVGGTANWDATAGSKWATTSGGAGGAAVPTAADDVFFDANSNTGSPITVTQTVSVVCRSLNFTGFTRTFVKNSNINLTIGDGTAGASNIALKLVSGMTITFGSQTTGEIIFASTSATQQTIDCGGKTMGAMNINGAGSSYILSSAISAAGATFTVAAGTFDTGNFNMTFGRFIVSGSSTRTVTLGSSTITLSSGAGGNGIWDATTTTNLTFNRGTSSISASGGNNNFTGGGLTYYDVSINSSGGSLNMIGANTFHNLTIAPSSSGRTTIDSDLVVTNLATLTSASSTSMGFILSSVRGTQRTITAGSVSVVNANLQDIVAAGASAPWTATNTGDMGNNSNITFPTGVTRYWVATTGGSWAATSSWSTSTGGASGASIPLVQDTAVFDANSITSSGRTITINQQCLPTLDLRNVTNNPTVTINITNGQIWFGKDIYFKSGLTLSALGSHNLGGRGSQVILSAGNSLNVVNIDAASGTYTLLDDFSAVASLSVPSGTFNAATFNVTIPTFTSNGTNTRAVVMGSGTWTVTGNNATIWNVITVSTLTFTRGNAIVCNYSGSAGVRTIVHTDTGEASCPSFNVTAGTDSVSFSASGIMNINLTGFSGTFSNGTRTLYGSLTISATTTVGAGSLVTSFRATSGTQNLTTNGVALDFNITLNNPGATFKLLDNLTTGSSRNITHTAGTFDANNKNITIGTFASSNSNVRSILMGSGTWTLTGTGTVWTCGTSTNLTLTAGTSTIAITDTSATSKTFVGGAQMYYNVTITGGGSAVVAIQSNNNHFNIFRVLNGPTTLRFSQGNTYFMDGDFIAVGTAGNLISIESAVAGTPAILSKAHGLVAGDYLSIKDSTATGGAGWAAGSHSVNVSGNTGWVFADISATTDTFAGRASGFLNSTNTFTGKLTGVATLTDIIAARLTGVATTDNEMAARATGFYNVTNILDAFATGVASTDDELLAFLIGQIESHDTLSGYTIGQILLTDTFIGRCFGIDITTPLETESGVFSDGKATVEFANPSINVLFNEANNA